MLSANGGGVGRVEEHGGEGSKEQKVVQRQERQQLSPEDPLQGRGGRFRDKIKFPFFSSRKGKKTVTFGLAPKEEDYARSNLATFHGRDGINDGNGQGGRSRREGEGEKDKNDENGKEESVSSQGSNGRTGVAQEKNIPAAYGGVHPGHQLGDVVAPGMMAGVNPYCEQQTVATMMRGQDRPMPRGMGYGYWQPADYDPPPPPHHPRVQPYELFGDENPNSCSVT